MPDGVLDCGVVGGGVIGLSIARELAGRGLSVAVLSAGSRRESSSWAAAGILPPAPMPRDVAAEPNAALTAQSDRLLREWSETLRSETSIDNGLRPSGGLHLAGDAMAVARLEVSAADWRRRGAAAEMLAAADVVGEEPAVREAVEAGRIVGGMLLPGETQIRSPRHLEAVAKSCLNRGVRLLEAAEVRQFDVEGGRVVAARTEAARLVADRWVLAAGAWSQRLAPALRLAVSTTPIRGQIALLAPGRKVVSRIINVGLDYMLQRDDGRLLVGSTIEDAGFDPVTTAEAVSRMIGFARGLVPWLADVPVEQTWAGLRPGSTDGLPTIGPVPGLDNAFVATGHFRAGLHQSTGTAVMIADLICGRQPSIPVAAFAADRRMDPKASGGIDDYLARASGRGEGSLPNSPR